MTKVRGEGRKQTKARPNPPLTTGQKTCAHTHLVVLEPFLGGDF